MILLYSGFRNTIGLYFCRAQKNEKKIKGLMGLKEKCEGEGEKDVWEEGDAVNINGGSEARVVIGAFSAVVVGR